MQNVDMESTERDASEILFTDERNRFALSKATSRGQLRRIGWGIYTRSRDEPSEVVRRNLWAIVGHAFPGAVVTDRSARRWAPDNDGRLTVVHPRSRPLTLPGVTIAPRRGPGPVTGDTALPFGVWGASPERGMLENLGARATVRARYLTAHELEAWIVDLAAQSNGADRLNDLRDRARQLAPTLGLPRALDRLTSLVSAALVTGEAGDAQSDVLRTWARGDPFDRIRVERFEALRGTLDDLAPDPLPSLPADEARRALLPFYEAYFSNYIEGTEFTLDEAAEIVFDDTMPANRPQDAHDIIGTYQLVADPAERRRTPIDAGDFAATLLARHRTLLGARPEVLPGQFKERGNQAGSTIFVAPDLVRATLRRGFEVADGLIDPFARAVYMMFVVSDVHPFVDGNGRIARVMMNAELSAGGQGRIIIPTVYRLNYLAALKGATHNSQFDSLLATLRFAQRYTARVDFSDRTSAERDLAATSALRDPVEAEDYGVRLRMPTGT